MVLSYLRRVPLKQIVLQNMLVCRTHASPRSTSCLLYSMRFAERRFTTVPTECSGTLI